jgi:uncharacterized protein
VGRDEIEKFLTAKWKKEHGYRLRKELFAFTDNKVSVGAVAYAGTSYPSLTSNSFSRSLSSFGLSRIDDVWPHLVLTGDCRYEWHDEEGNWIRSMGLEDWTFDQNGLSVVASPEAALMSVETQANTSRSACEKGR